MDGREPEELAARFDALIRSISRRIRRETRPLIESLGLTWARLSVLIAARRSPGLTMGSLADRLGLSRSTVTTLVDELVRQGLLSREQDPQDRRVLRVRILAAGIDLLDRVLERRREVVARAFGEMGSEELETVLAVLERVDDRLHKGEAKG